jgi:acyl-CoA reductase-like NAD-dependent aldehyde dehydrogenase
MRTIQHWIAGSETTGEPGRCGPVYNPATGAKQAQVALAGTADVGAAVAAASKAFDQWREVSLIRQARVMFALRDLIERHTDKLARIVADEHGKVVSDAKGEVIRGLEVVEYACGIPTLLKWEYVDRGEQAGATLVADGRGLKVTGHEDGFFVGPCLFDHVTADIDIYTDEIFGPVLVVLRAGTFAEAIDIVNANPYGNGTAIFTSSGRAAKKFQRNVQVGMIGINVPIPVPMAFYSFGGWKDSLFGDTHIHGPEGIRFYTRAKAITSRWPDAKYQEHHRAHMHFPTAT